VALENCGRNRVYRFQRKAVLGAPTKVLELGAQEEVWAPGCGRSGWCFQDLFPSSV